MNLSCFSFRPLSAIAQDPKTFRNPTETWFLLSNNQIFEDESFVFFLPSLAHSVTVCA